MDIPTPQLDGLEATATRLDRCAERIEAQAGVARSGVSEAWQGPAADRHREVVAGHVSDLEHLADRLRGAAVSVRHLGSTARARIADLGQVDITARVRR